MINNREKLLKFLPEFLEDRNDDMQFCEERAYCVKMIQQLPAQPVAAIEGQKGGITAEG